MKTEQIASKRGYVVTEQGIFMNPAGKILKSINEKGYIYTNIRIEGKNVTIKAHRIQAFQKYGEKLYELGMMVRHFNGIPSDNSWKNILIGTHSQNMMDVPEQIRIKKALHATSFVRKYDKQKIKDFHINTNSSYKKTMLEFGITSKGTLHFILNN